MALCICGCRDGHEHVLDERGMSTDVVCVPCGRRVCGERIDRGAPGAQGRTLFRFRLWDGTEGVSTGVPWRVRRPAAVHSCGLSDLPCAGCVVEGVQERGEGVPNSFIRLAWGGA